ncbi:ATPase [Altericroceibacterium spongiae]|uniref:ATPase n=1 Tax=Altericroceibacterium spongiae TaxID=2320269 RepID=A0A420ERL3_9SPHN|nr:ATPase [Altericroceibacterium spongiae]RKF23280.1 ATPase [Altericroceibacterium spongiae]
MASRKNLVSIGSHEPNASPSPENEGLDTPTYSTGNTPDANDSDDLIMQDEWSEDPTLQDEEVSGAGSGAKGWLLPVLASAAILIWTAFFIYAHRTTMLNGASVQDWSDWITAWSVPVLLVVALWLLAMRNSRRETARFRDAALSLSQESARLEERLSTVNRELSLARDFIAAQSRDLDSLGRVATDRISGHADRLQELIRDNGNQVEAISRVSNTALGNMEKLRGDLPVIANSARDVANQIGQAGNTAQDQLNTLISGFEQLNALGDTNRQQVESVREEVNATLAGFEAQASQLEVQTRARFTALQETSQDFRSELDRREIQALAVIRRRAEALGEEIAAKRAELARHEEDALAALRERGVALNEEGARIARDIRNGQDEALARWKEEIGAVEERMQDAFRQISETDRRAVESAQKRLLSLNEQTADFDTRLTERLDRFDAEAARRASLAQQHEAEALAALDARLTTFDAQLIARQEEQVEYVNRLVERGDALSDRVASLNSQMQAIVAQGDETGHLLAETVSALRDRVTESRDTLENTGTLVQSITNDGIRLLEIIRSSADHGRTDLPEAVTAAEAQLAQFEERIESIAARLGDAGRKGAEISHQVESARQEGAAALQQLDELHDRLAEKGSAHSTHIAALREELGAANAESTELAERAQTELQQAINAMQDAARQAITNLEGENAEAIRAIAARIAQESGDAITEALREHTEKAVGQLEDSASRASTASQEAAAQLANELRRVDELAGNLESRVAYAREQAEEQLDNDFSRRMALIIESLNSSAIDIGKVFSNEVTDTAWASYLRGDRGIFTRRAVRLLDNSEARQIIEIYEEDPHFRETVSRYIHDFEAMLRDILSTRDGNALGVTLLSSDMGRLYVALAQAIDRLRS